MASRPFSIEETEHHGRSRLVLTGELDLGSAPELEAALTRLCEAGVSEIEIDLREVDFIDSTGLRAILIAKDTCAKEGIEFFLVPSRRESQHKLFEITGLLNVLPWRRR
jgi:anti-anti-sigma factor